MSLISRPLTGVRAFRNLYASAICFVNYIMMKKNKAALSAKNKVRGIVNMKSNTKKLAMSGFILSILLVPVAASTIHQYRYHPLKIPLQQLLIKTRHSTVLHTAAFRR
jgi:hypothetical protein